MQYTNFDNLRRYIAQEYEKGRALNYSVTQFTELTVTLYDIYTYCKNNITANISVTDSDISDILLIEQISDMENYILELFSGLHQSLQSSKIAGYSKYIGNSLKIIHREYHNPSLSLNLIAEMLHINASYLSRTFKAEVGIGISEYINKHRIKHAKDLLLLEHLTVKETAERCGFESYTYFFRIFKKIEGMTPKEYLDEFQN